jgi:hypothetical protein
MGEASEPVKTALAPSGETMVAQTIGGRMYVRWDETTQATPHKPLVFFAEFLATAGVVDRTHRLVVCAGGSSTILRSPPKQHDDAQMVLALKQYRPLRCAARDRPRLATSHPYARCHCLPVSSQVHATNAISDWCVASGALALDASSS